MPLVWSVSNRDPASIQTPTVAVLAERDDSVAMRRPEGRVVMRVSGEVRISEWEVRVGCGELCFKKRGSGLSSCLSFWLMDRARRS